MQRIHLFVPISNNVICDGRVVIIITYYFFFLFGLFIGQYDEVYLPGERRTENFTFDIDTGYINWLLFKYMGNEFLILKNDMIRYASFLQASIINYIAKIKQSFL